MGPKNSIINFQFKKQKLRVNASAGDPLSLLSMSGQFAGPARLLGSDPSDKRELVLQYFNLLFLGRRTLGYVVHCLQGPQQTELQLPTVLIH